MEGIDQPSLQEVLATTGIKMADPDRSIGRELSFAQPAARTLLIHLGESAEHVTKVMLAILTMEDRWFLINRYGSVAQLGLVANAERAAALCISSAERDCLGRYLWERPMDLGAASVDVYLLGVSGNVLVTWDHHTADVGLSVELRRIGDASRLLMSLNEIGAEMEIFCAESA